MHGEIFCLLENLALQLGLGQHASLRDSNYVAAAFPVEASHAKVTQRATFKGNPLLPFSHMFGLNTTFCNCIAASCVV